MTYIASPSHHHYAQWAQACLRATVWGSPRFDGATVQTRLNDTLDGASRGAWARVLDQTIVRGNSLDNEVVFFHQPSRTLILTDLCFNISSRNASLMTKVAAKSLGVLDTFAPSRAFKVATTDKDALRATISTILEWDFDHIIISHGDGIERSGKAHLRSAFSWLFSS